MTASLFEASSIQTDDIRDDQEYHGIRVRLRGFLGGRVWLYRST